MKIVITLLVIVIALLSVAAGIAKVMQAPQEVQFLQSFGFNSLMITVYGVVQILGGALLSNKRGRLYGAVIVAVGLLVSSILIFASGNIGFGMVSLLPIILTGVIIQHACKSHPEK